MYEEIDPVPLAILARSHISGGKVSIDELSEWLDMPKGDILTTIIELLPKCKISNGYMYGRFEDEKEDNTVRCPHDKIVELWNFRMDGVLEKVRFFDSTSLRGKNMTARWRTIMEILKSKGIEQNETNGLAFLESMFKYILTSSFLMGKVPGRDGRKPFKATLKFVFQAESFQNIINKTYS